MLVIDKPSSETNNESLDPFQDYGMFCSDDNEATTTVVKLNNVDKQNEQKNNLALTNIEKALLIHDEFDSDASVTTVATKSKSKNNKPDSPVSMVNEMKHYLSPNCDHRRNSVNTTDGCCNDPVDNKTINPNFVQDLSVSCLINRMLMIF